jgi:hypothetical protein
MFIAISAITCSRVFPPAEEDLGWMLSTVSKMILVSFWLVMISAFAWRPNASGSGLRGRV